MNNFKKIFENIQESNPSLVEKFSKIKLICLDFDGTFTDNTISSMILKNEKGFEEIETITRSKIDSLAVDLLEKKGFYKKKEYKLFNHKIDLVFLSKETSPVVRINTDKVKIKCISSVIDKMESLKREVFKRKLKMFQVLFMGNDFNDLECIKAAGIGVAVGDGVDYIKDSADYITIHFGGKGAFREICEITINSKKQVQQ